MKIIFFLCCLAMMVCVNSCDGDTKLPRDQQALANVKKQVSTLLQSVGANLGSPVYLRIIKEEWKLELWVQPKQQDTYVLVKTYPIAGMSGHLGPKLKQGDMQAPEGFYEVERGALNPQSSYHLSFNIGYPNAYDRALGRTGSLIMVHGSNVSVGCFAMTNPGIEEIYTMVAQAVKQGQRTVPVQIYPFIPTAERLKKERNSPYYAFWQTMAQAWQWSSKFKKPVPYKFLGKEIKLLISP